MLSSPYKKGVLSLVGSLLFAFSLYYIEGLNVLPLPKEEDPLHFFSNALGDDLRKGFASAIASAKEQIVLMIFSLTDPSLIAALNEKAKSGVTIKLIVDADASPHISRKLHPSIALVKRYGKGLMHLKILVVDQKITWLGSANFTGDSLRVHGNLVLALHSEPLAFFCIEKAKSLTSFERTALFPRQLFLLNDSTNQTLSLHFLPDDQEAHKKLIYLIDTAKKSVRVAMYTWTQKELFSACLKAKMRGVRVDIAIDRSSTHGASHKIASLLVFEGMHVHNNRGKGLLHYKWVLIDNHTLAHGSANWTKGAFSKNDDYLLFLSPLSNTQMAFMEKLWQKILSQ